MGPQQDPEQLSVGNNQINITITLVTWTQYKCPYKSDTNTARDAYSIEIDWPVDSNPIIQ